MGAYDFQTTEYGSDAAKAFTSAVDHALYESGHGGYTGTIAEKHEFNLFVLPPRIKARDIVRAAWDYNDYLSAVREVEEAERDNLTAKRGHKINVHAETRKAARRSPLKGALRKHEDLVRHMSEVAYGDKWGPAACLELTGSELLKGAQKKVFIFFGMASA